MDFVHFSLARLVTCRRKWEAAPPHVNRQPSTDLPTDSSSSDLRIGPACTSLCLGAGAGHSQFLLYLARLGLHNLRAVPIDVVVREPDWRWRGWRGRDTCPCCPDCAEPCTTSQPRRGRTGRWRDPQPALRERVDETGQHRSLVSRHPSSVSSPSVYALALLGVTSAADVVKFDIT